MIEMQSQNFHLQSHWDLLEKRNLSKVCWSWKTILSIFYHFKSYSQNSGKKYNLIKFFFSIIPSPHFQNHVLFSSVIFFHSTMPCCMVFSFLKLLNAHSFYIPIKMVSFCFKSGIGPIILSLVIGWSMKSSI